MHLNSLSPIESLFIDQIIVVNSSIKLEWLKEHSGWEADVKDTREWMLQAMTSFSCYEDPDILHERAERPMNIVRFWRYVIFFCL